MGSIRTGARELGLDVQWRFSFVGPGEVVQAVPDAVFLDVGGSLAPGILDQHHDQSLGASTTELIRRFPAHVYDHLMLDWLARARSGEDLEGRVWRPTIVTHRAPDFDAITAAYLVMQLIEHGDPPTHADALTQYSSEVDQGRYSVDLERPETATHALHLAFLAIQNVRAPEGTDCGDTWRLLRGVDLIERSMASIEAARSEAQAGPLRTGNQIHPGQPGADAWRDMEDFADARELLDADIDRYLADRESATQRQVELPAIDGADAISVPALILDSPPESILNKYWVRADGFPYFICPYGPNQGSEEQPHFGRVILSLDPLWRDAAGGHPTLHGLGFSLECEESRVREAKGGDRRAKTPRYDDGSCDNDDPWYDGRGHGFGIVDAPRSGTSLSYAEVQRVATSPFWRIPLEDAEVVVVRAAASDQPGPAGGQPPQPFQSMSPVLKPYLGSSRSVDLGRAGEEDPSMPPGFEPAAEGAFTRRFFPPETTGPVDVLTLRAKPGEATLDELLIWVREQREAEDLRVYVCTWLRLGQHFSSPEHVDALLSGLAGGREAAERIEEGGELLLFDSQTIVLEQRRSSAASQDVERLRERLRAHQEMMIYGVFINETLGAFSERVSRAVDSRGKVHGASAIRNHFLAFQARYFQHAITTDPAKRRIYQTVIDGLEVALTYEEVQSELDRLDHAAQRASSSKMEILLFAIGLGGIVEAITSIPHDSKMWGIAGLKGGVSETVTDVLTDGVADGAEIRLVLLLLLLPFAAGAFWWLRRRTREKDPG